MYTSYHSCHILMKLEFLHSFSKNTHFSNFTKIRLVRAELFTADGQTNKCDQVNNRFFAILRTPLNTEEEQIP
jgi:hypothetical protein